MKVKDIQEITAYVKKVNLEAKPAEQTILELILQQLTDINKRLTELENVNKPK